MLQVAREPLPDSRARSLWMEKGTFHGRGEGQAFVAQYATKWPDWYRQEIEGAFVITANG